MPVSRWTNGTSLESGSVIFDVSKPDPDFLCYHAALVIKDGAIASPKGQCAEVFHMTLGGLARAQYPLTSSCFIASFPDMTTAERRTVTASIVELEENWPPKQIYYLGTHCIDDVNSAGQEDVPLKGSCASLIEFCFENSADTQGNPLDLVKRETVPIISVEQLRDCLKSSHDPAFFAAIMTRRRYVDGPGPWPILLPAYQARAFEMSRDNLPRDATLVDHPYPDRPAAQ